MIRKILCLLGFHKRNMVLLQDALSHSENPLLWFYRGGEIDPADLIKRRCILCGK